MISFTIISNSDQDTRRVASSLAPFLCQGDIILFKGPLASGKTLFIKALAVNMGSDDLVTSPTYSLANFYSTTICDLLHIDVYRLAGIDEFRDLGLDEFFDESITVIEWGDKVINEFKDYLLIELEIDPTDNNQRLIKFTPKGTQWGNKLKSIQNIIQRS